MTMDALTGQIPLYLLISMRFLGLLYVAPALVGASFPVAFVFWLSALLSVIVMPGLGGSVPEALFSGLFPLFLAGARELLVGSFIGFVSACPFYVLQVSGRMIGTSMGLAMVSVLDPISQDEESIVGQFQLLVGLWFFLYWNGHMLLVKAATESFRLLPLGGMGLALSGDMGLAKWAGDLFSMAFMVSIPFYGALLLADIGLGFLARTVPQMNVFILGLPIKIGLGLFLIMVLLPPIVDILHDSIEPFLRLALMGLGAWR